MVDQGNLKNKLLVSRIAWNNRGWRGFDFDGYKNRKKFGFKYVQEHGIAHEWWNFYPFDEENYYGQVDYHGKIPASIQNDALVLFISINYNDNKPYLVGFYSHTEFGNFQPEIKMIDTISDKSIREHILDDINNSRVIDDTESSIMDLTTYSAKAKQRDSTVFIEPIPIDITEDLGLIKLGSPPYYLVGEDRPIKPQNVKKILEKAVKFYEGLLNSTELEEQSVREIIRKTEKALSYYFDSSENYGDFVEMTKLQTILESKKQIILYGPPGTGKTWHAQHLLRNDDDHYYSQMKSTLFDQRVFSITILPSRDGPIVDLQPGDTFTYEWSGRRNWQKYYDELEAGDHLLAYSSAPPTRQYKAILRCNRKDENAIHGEFVRKWDGPTYQQMKSDSVLSETVMMRVSMAFSLKKLDDVEFERIQALSPELTNESLGLVSTRDEEKVNKIEFVTFHPSFGYEEFVEGLRPKTDEDGTLTFYISDGIFKHFAQAACNILFKEAGIDRKWLPGGNIPGLDESEKKIIRDTAPKVPFYLVIDEINRGDISRIFGELITLLEADKRYGEVNEIITTLPYSKTSFAIPPNVYLIGTMNTADKSIALVDTALRRRFGFLEMMPDYELLQRLFVDVSEDVKPVADMATTLLKEINARIRERYDRDHQIGHSYLVPLRDATTRDEAVEILRSAWYYEILPLLQEYFYDSPKKLHEVIGEAFVSVEGDHSFSFTDELSGEAFLRAVESIASPDSGTRTEEGSD